MERMITDRRAEAARLAREKTAKADAERRTALLRMVADHRAALDIRTFVMTALETLGSSMAKEGPAADWAAWAFGVADQIDPVGRLHIAEDGTAAEASAVVPCCISVPIATGSEMPEDDSLQAIKHLLFNFVRSPSLRHIRDPHTIIVLANEIMRVVNGRNSIWLKWDEQREKLVKSAVGCWIPLDDLRDFLNRLAGPALTTADVTQRMRAFEDEDYFSYPKEELQPGCPDDLRA